MSGVSKEQIRQARNTNLFAYLQSSEPGVLKRDGPNYRHREHDSLVYVAAKDYWYWNSRGKKINALDYLMEIRGYGLVEAVNALTGSASSISYHAPVRPKPPPRPTFSLPWVKRCATGAITYLQRRGIHHQVIGRCMKLGLLYESTYKGSPVCVFVGKDDTGTAKFACMRGMAEAIKKDVYGSDKQFSFCLPPQDPGSRELAVFEAPIDALSHASLQVMQGWKWDGYRLSLGGTSPVALVSFLERHPEIRKVNLYMDNDLAGIVNARKIRRLLSADDRFRHIRVGIHPPHEGKDYNDKLLYIIIADPENEYGPLVERFGAQGQVIDISPNSTNYINPMDINLDYSDDENPVTLKSDFLLSLCDLIIGGKEGLSPIEKTIIDRCTRLVYRDYLQDPRPENMPILGDLYDLLRKQTEPEAQNIATALEIYVNGSLNVFNHRSNIQMNDHRVLCFQLKSLGKALKEIGLLIMQDAVWNRVTANRSKHKTTWFYIDEFHLLLKGQTGSFSVEIWKRFRKWGGIPSGLTQNVKDLLASREIENIFENSDFIYMLNQAQGDRQILAKQLGISPHQLSYVTHSGPGEGLLFFGNVIIPFVDRFPKDTTLYKIMTTRPDEMTQSGA